MPRNDVILLRGAYLRPGWAARIRDYDESGGPHLVQVDGEVAGRARPLRITWDDAGVMCPVFKDDETGEVYYQRGNGSVPAVEERHNPWLQQVELCSYIPSPSGTEEPTAPYRTDICLLLYESPTRRTTTK